MLVSVLAGVALLGAGGVWLYRALTGELTGEPVIERDFPDPSVLPVRQGIQEVYWAFATNDERDNVQVQRSTDLFHWSEQPDALPTLPSWADTGSTWGPTVQGYAGGYVLYFSARSKADDTQCIGTATSEEPGGPYTPAGTSAGSSAAPLVCQTDAGGSIDPAVYHDGEHYWLVWKNDGDSTGDPVALWARPLTDDGLAFTDGSSATKILEPSEAWQGDLIEAPDMVGADGRLYLFYAADDFDTKRYAIGYATCESPTGPCTNRSKRPFVHSADKVEGPGGASIFEDPLGRWWMAFHGWRKGDVGYENGGRRAMYLDPITFHRDRGPTTAAPRGVTSAVG